MVTTSPLLLSTWKLDNAVLGDGWKQCICVGTGSMSLTLEIQKHQWFGISETVLQT